MSLLAEIGVLTVLLLCAAIGGYAFRSDRTQAAITAAQSDTAVCQAALDSKQTALDRVGKSLADLRDRHATALADATAALDARDADIAALQAAAAHRTTTIRENAHADADCASLARLPVCAAVAGQLWPAIAAPGTAAAH